MQKIVRVGLSIGVVAVLAAAGLGVASAATSQHEAFKACSTSSGALRLIKSGRCAKGSHKVTVSAKGPRGPVGPFPSSLPSGKTETGAFFLSTDGSAGFTQIGFTFPLTADLSSSHAPALVMGAPSSTHCTGGYDNPKAARGYLCLYLAVADNVNAVTPLKLGSGDGASKAGAIIGVVAADTSQQMTVSGSWAVTAP